MDPEFWHRKWKNNEIGFHVGRANPALVDHFHTLSLEKGSRVFLPLCGKTLDIGWLLSMGYRVAGSELSAVAIEQLFAELGLEPRVADVGPLKHYNAENIDIYVGDIFDLTIPVLGQVDAIYDRAALVALPEQMRGHYAAHLMKITQQAPQLLVTFVYDQNQFPGPPFSLSAEEVHRRYGGRYQVRLLERKEVPGGLKGQCAADEHIWLLTD